jgi:hypothetical protein
VIYYKQGDSRIKELKGTLDNYPDVNSRLDRIEQVISDLQEKVAEIIRIIIELEERVTPVVEAQRIRDIWDGI